MNAVKTLRYKIVNVFTEKGKAFTGNPLAVIYDGEDLSQAQCLTLARQFNLSEITFPHAIARQEGRYSVRIFTIGSELPFAGHPTLGTCFSLLHSGLDPSQGKAIQTSLSGETRLSFAAPSASPYEPARISMRATKHGLTGHLTHSLNVLSAALGLPDTTAIKYARIASCGLHWPIAQLESVDAVKAASLNGELLLKWLGSLGETSIKPGIEAIALFALDTTEGGELNVFMRVLCYEKDKLAVIEDPATGSAGLALGLVLEAEKLLPQSLSYTISQGTEIQMPSQLHGRVELDQAGMVVAVHLAGDVVQVGSGEILCP